MIIYLVRHGETYWNIESIFQGWSNNPLNEKGITQAQKVAEEISQLKPCAFYSSDLMRAKQTAEIINNELGMEIVLDNRLREFSLGEFEGHPKSVTPLQTHELYKHEFGAETPEDVFTRAKDFVAELKTKNLDSVLVVSHRGLIQMIRYCISRDKWHDEDSESFFGEVFYKTPHAQVMRVEV